MNKVILKNYNISGEKSHFVEVLFSGIISMFFPANKALIDTVVFPMWETEQ